MVYDPKTYKLFHRLTQIGYRSWEWLLEKKADEILYKHDHPFKYFYGKLKEALQK